MATTLREGADIINESLRTLGYEYQIDVTNNDTITAGIEIIGAYPPSQRNQIMEQMNLILQTRNYGAMFNAEKNKFRAFLIDMTTEGFGVEDVFHELIEGRTPYWDGNATATEIATDLVSGDEAKVHKIFHTSKMEHQVKAHIDRRNYEKVFTERGVTRYIDTKLANMSWSMEKWLMDEAVGLVKSMISDQKIVALGGHSLNSKNGIDGTVETIKSTMKGFLTLTDLYNYGVYDDTTNQYRKLTNITDSEDDIFLIITPEFMARLEVYGYSNAFNLSQYALEGRVLYAPAGTDLGEMNGEKVLACILDRRSILMGIRRWNGTSFFIPNISEVNHWLTAEGIKGYNTFFNAVAITGEAVDDFFVEGGSTASINVILRNDTSDFAEVYVDNKRAYFTKVSGDDYWLPAEKIPAGSEIIIKNTGSINDIYFNADNTGTVLLSGGDSTVKLYPNSTLVISPSSSI